MSVVLHSDNFHGNIHEVVSIITKLRLAESVLSIHHVSSNVCIVVFRLHASELERLKKERVL